jgi:DNA-binding NarL/FixJ family response regulator
VVLIEDNEVFREALELLLTAEEGVQIVAAEPDGARAVELCKELRPEVLLVDYRLPGLDGVQVTRLVRARCSGVAVVALTAAADAREIRALLDAGAVACVRKDEPLEVLVGALQAAARGGGAQ